MDRILEEMKAPTCVLDLYRSCFIKAVRRGLVKWIRVLNASLWQDGLPVCLKRAVVKPMLKKFSLNLILLDNFLNLLVLDNYRPVSKFSFWAWYWLGSWLLSSKVPEWDELLRSILICLQTWLWDRYGSGYLRRWSMLGTGKEECVLFGCTGLLREFVYYWPCYPSESSLWERGWRHYLAVVLMPPGGMNSEDGTEVSCLMTDLWPVWSFRVQFHPLSYLLFTWNHRKRLSGVFKYSVPSTLMMPSSISLFHLTPRKVVLL